MVNATREQDLVGTELEQLKYRRAFEDVNSRLNVMDAAIENQNRKVNQLDSKVIDVEREGTNALMIHKSKLEVQLEEWGRKVAKVDKICKEMKDKFDDFDEEVGRRLRIESDKIFGEMKVDAVTLAEMQAKVLSLDKFEQTLNLFENNQQAALRKIEECREAFEFCEKQAPVLTHFQLMEGL
jgi:methyl coenzyme M reductase subunit D